MLQFIKEHELTHRSQMFVYMRLKGIVPATTRRRPGQAEERLKLSLGNCRRVSYKLGEGGGFCMVLCPECDAQIDVDEGDVDEGDSLSHDEFGADLKVVSVTPLELEAEEDEEEEEDEDDDSFSDDDDDEEEEREEEEDWK